MTAQKLTTVEGKSVFNAETEADTAPAVEETPDIVKLAQDQKRFKKKVADVEDQIIDADESITEAKASLTAAESLEDCEAAVKVWRKAENNRERLDKNLDSYKDMLHGVTRKMQAALEEPE